MSSTVRASATGRAASKDSSAARSISTKTVGKSYRAGSHLSQDASASAPVEIANDRTETTDTFDLGNGLNRTVSYAGPVNYKDADGAWQPIDNTLVSAGASGWKNTAGAFAVSLPINASGPMRVSNGSAWTSFALVGADSTGTASDSTATYPNALPGATVKYTVTNVGVKEDIMLASALATRTFAYTVDSSSGLSLAAGADGGLVVQTAGKSTEFTLPAPVLTDAAGAESFTSTMKATTDVHGVTTVTVVADPTWLASPDRVFPVDVDPSPLFSATKDCHVVSGSGYADTSYCNSLDVVEVGNATGPGFSHGLLAFDTSAIATDARVTDADLALYRTSYGGTLPIDVAKVTQNWDQTATWNHATSTTAWTTPGGTTDGKTYTNAGQETVDTTVGWHHWAVADLAQALVNDPSNNFGLLLKGHDSTLQKARFSSITDPAHNYPQLTITWAAPVGDQSWWSYTKHRLNDRSQLQLNNGSGDEMLHAQDIHIAASGLAVNVDRFYNSLTTDTGSMGVKTRLSVGPDVTLSRDTHDGSTSGDNTFTYVAPSGTAFLFRWSSTDGSGYRHYTNSSLSAEITDHGASGTSATLDFHQSGEQYQFTTSGSTEFFVQSADLDKNKNKITYNYTGTQLSSITHQRRSGGTSSSPTYDAADITLTVGYNANGYLNLITDANGPTTRRWQYGYIGSQLTSYTDPNNNETDYGYDANNNINQIQDPPPTAGAPRPTTNLSSSPRGKLNYVRYIKDSAANYYEYDVLYRDPINTTTSRCTANGTRTLPSGGNVAATTEITDPNNSVTTYCYDRKDEVKRTVDGEGNFRDAQYTTADAVDQYTDANSQIFGFARDANSNITKISEPKSSGSTTAATTSFDYSGSTGTGFLPTSTVDAQNHCTASDYDTSGNLTDTYAGNTPSGGNCNTATGGSHSQLAYNTDGTVKSFKDPVGNTTYYDYPSSSNNGFPNQVRQPGNDCSSTSTRKNCTALTYDGLNRQATSTDGRGNTTTYAYDNLDRVTALYFGGATSCDAGKTNCVVYTYDAEGNLTKRADATGSTTFGFDRLNQPTTKAAPGVPVVTTGFDGAGNLSSYQVGGDSTSYGYNHDNQVSTITDAGGTVTYSYGSGADPGNVKARLKSVSYPGGTVSVAYTYTESGKIKTITPSGISGQGGYSYTWNNGATDNDVMHTAATSGVTTTYSYDALNRLTLADASSGTDYGYGYDANGNMTSASVNGSTSWTAAYNSVNQICWRLSGTSSNTCGTVPSGAGTFTYDGAGNLTAVSNGWSLTYNSRGQATSITPASGTATAGTYADADQSERATYGTTTMVNGALGVSATVTGGSTTRYTRDPSGQTVDQRTVGGATYYYLTDGQHNVRALFTAAGAAKALYTYQPYGAEITQTQPDQTVHDGNPFRFADGYYDNNTLYHFGARYYNTAGQWWQQDTQPGQISNAGSTNRYAYVGGNPLQQTDPTGHGFCADSDYEGECNGFSAIGSSSLVAGGAEVAGGGVDIAAEGLAAGTAVSTGLVAGAITFGVGLIAAGIGFALASFL